MDYCLRDDRKPQPRRQAPERLSYEQTIFSHLARFDASSADPNPPPPGVSNVNRDPVEQYTPSRAGIAAQHAGRGGAQAIGHERHRHRFVSEQIDLEAMSMP